MFGVFGRGKGAGEQEAGQAMGTAVDTPSSPAASAGKGRPTPSRKEAEAARKAELKPVLDKKASRERAREERLRIREQQLAGNERYLPTRDKGDVRRFTRDFVDARRHVGEFMLPAIIVFLVGGFIPDPRVGRTMILAFYAFFLLVVVDTLVLALRLRSSLNKQFETDAPGRKGAVLYGVLRSLQSRRLRLPKPQVKPGALVG